MQFLYALERHKEAYHEMAREKTGSHFEPDLNANETQDTILLSATKKEAFKAFDESFNHSDGGLSQYPDEISKAVEDGFLFYSNLVEQQKQSGLKVLKGETELVANSYARILWLPVLWKEIIVADWNKAVNDGKRLGTGYRNLVSNPLVEAIENNERISSLYSKGNTEWDSEIVHEWYRKLVRKDEAFMSYSEKSKPVIEDHIEMIDHLFKKVVFKNEVIDAYMEENDLAWSENRGILKSMVIKTLKTFDPKTNTVQQINLSPNWEEDEQFYQNLYKKTIGNEDDLEKVIAEKSKNWDVDRIAAVDMIIMKMALTEFQDFPSIPIKVTINEYIEICKAYSTPKSKQYVNGILDVLSNQLKKDGAIKKSGRGLLDNK